MVIDTLRVGPQQFNRSSKTINNSLWAVIQHYSWGGTPGLPIITHLTVPSEPIRGQDAAEGLIQQLWRRSHAGWRQARRTPAINEQ